jgi:nucleoside-diphosphate-sugar epimerase
MARIAVTGATGGLGANVVAAALDAGHEVVALCRAPGKVDPRVRVVLGDALNGEDVTRAAAEAEALIHCANPLLVGDWSGGQARMAEAAIAAAKATGARLVFPGNVWVYGPRRPGERVPDDAPYAPASEKGAARARIEQEIQAAGIRWTIVRIAEFYGPHVATLLGPPLRALTRGEAATWYGPGDVEIELAYMPEVGRSVLAAALAPQAENRRLNVPTAGPITPRRFLELARARAGGGSARFVPAIGVRLAAWVYAPATAFADILHLWTDPVILDCSGWRALGLPDGGTSYEAGIDATLAWWKAHPDARTHVG